MGWINSLFGIGLVAGTVISSRIPARLRTARTVVILVALNSIGDLLYVGTDRHPGRRRRRDDLGPGDRGHGAVVAHHDPDQLPRRDAGSDHRCLPGPLRGGPSAPAGGRSVARRDIRGPALADLGRGGGGISRHELLPAGEEAGRRRGQGRAPARVPRSEHRAPVGRATERSGERRDHLAGEELDAHSGHRRGRGSRRWCMSSRPLPRAGASRRSAPVCPRSRRNSSRCALGSASADDTEVLVLEPGQLVLDLGLGGGADDVEVASSGRWSRSPSLCQRQCSSRAADLC